VQGVGFRPFVYVLATRFGLKGGVENGPAGVTIDIYGEAQQIKRFMDALLVSAPESSSIESLTSRPLEIKTVPGNFLIKPSSHGAMSTTVPPDTAICSSCMREMGDKTNRRFGYPFTHCSHCGPRFSIIHAMPFDRENTSMVNFSMCEDCRAEYVNPKSRRFHNQANCCPQCGPRICLEDSNGRPIALKSSGAILDKAAAIIQSGGILALKGVGGFNLLCDATNHSAVDRLRQRKNRPSKALALMVRDIEAVKQFTNPDSLEMELLGCAHGPIVLLDRNNDALPENIAPKLNRLGFVLPYTALHTLLMKRLNIPVVFTSGNRSGTPQCISNPSARSELNSIADFFLMHDRDIVQRVDDSVMQVIDDQVQTVRLGRGLLPMHLTFPEGFSSSENIIGMGAQVKNTISFADEAKVVLSPPLDTLSDAASLLAYEERHKKMTSLYRFSPSKVVVDKHPQYQSTIYGDKLAEQLDIPLCRVQHHHAHLAACLFENGHRADESPVLGICFDGTGLGDNVGDDGEIWGAEFFLFNYQHCRRFASFESVPLLGSSLAITEPWRSAYAHLFSLGDFKAISRRYQHLELFGYFRTKPEQVLEQMMEKKINSPSASSAGRLFDAVAASLNICREKISYEGQAAMELQALAELAVTEQLPPAYPFELKQSKTIQCVVWAEMWRALLADIDRGVDKTLIALRFHVTVVAVILAVIDKQLEGNKTIKVALSGGVFQNRLLVSMLKLELQARGLSVYLPLKVPCNDSGISVGQAAVAIASKRF
jgi:hydrogenase maturation protein HypF